MIVLSDLFKCIKNCLQIYINRVGYLVIYIKFEIVHDLYHFFLDDDVLIQFGNNFTVKCGLKKYYNFHLFMIYITNHQ